MVASGAERAHTDTMKVQAQHVSQQFENRLTGETIDVLQDVNVSVRAGEFFSIVGPSGCGKTTLLRIIAGLLPATAGAILCDGDKVSGPSPRMAMVFQSDNLMPWRKVRDNVGLGPELRGESKRSYGPRVDKLIDLVGLTGF